MKIKMTKAMREVWMSADSIIGAEENHGMSNYEVVAWVGEIEGITLQEIDTIYNLISSGESPDEN